MTDIWGAKYWNFFHALSTYYPDNPSKLDKGAAMTLLLTIDKVLPCSKCAGHYRTNFRNFQIRNGLVSKDKFVRWFINFHNYTNMALKKNIMPVDIAISRINASDIANQLNEVLEFVEQILPETKNIHIGHVREIQRFMHAVTHLTGLNLGNFQFHNKQSFKDARKNLSHLV